MDFNTGFQIGAVTVENIGMALMVGILVCEQFFRERYVSADSLFKKKLSLIFFISLVVTLIANIFVFWFAVASMADLTLTGSMPVLVPAMTSTQVGWAWMVGMFALSALIVVFKVPTLQPAKGVLIWGLFIIYFCSRSAASHAAAADSPIVNIAIDTLHLFSTSVWLGIVIISAFVVTPFLSGTSEMQSNLVWEPFSLYLSRIATGALVVVLFTGAYKTWHGIGEMSQFISTSYGNVLGLKLILVTLAIALGAVNRFIFLPALHTSTLVTDNMPDIAKNYFIHVLKIESCVLLLVVFAASLLSLTTPVGN